MQTPKNSNRFLRLQEDTECMEESLRHRGHRGSWSSMWSHQLCRHSFMKNLSTSAAPDGRFHTAPGTRRAAGFALSCQEAGQEELLEAGLLWQTAEQKCCTEHDCRLGAKNCAGWPEHPSLQWDTHGVVKNWSLMFLLDHAVLLNCSYKCGFMCRLKWALSGDWFHLITSKNLTA